MRTMLKGMLVVLVVAALPLAASAQQLFDFNGQAILPGGVGGSLTMYSEVFDASPATTPIPLDFADYQFTLVVEDLVLDADGFTQHYSGGTVTLYQDAGTAADFADLSTFTDGTAILIGTITTLSRTMFPTGIGSVVGVVDWNGGTRLDDIAPEDQADWGFFSGVNSGDDQTLPGFDEMWDGKIEPREPIVDNEASSFGSVKALFRD